MLKEHNENKELLQYYYNNKVNTEKERNYYLKIIENRLFKKDEGFFYIHKFENDFLVFSGKTEEQLINDIKRDICFKWVNDFNILEKQIEITENNITKMLKYFKKDLNPKTKGTLLKLLSKKYRPFYAEHTVKSFAEIINHCIDNDLNIDLQYKTLSNNLLLKWNSSLKTWL